MLPRRCLVVCWALLMAAPAFAQGPIAFGDNHQGTLADPSEVDTWTFSANAGDQLIFSIATTPPAGTGGFLPEFVVTPPSMANFVYSAGGGRIPVAAPETGTYTLRAQSQATSVGGGDYLLRLLKIPGTQLVPTGDQGGPIAEAVTTPGQITLGDLDTWTFTGCVGATVRLTLLETPANPGNGFNPGLYLVGPTGTIIESGLGSSAFDVVTLPLVNAGTHTVVVYSGIASFAGPSDYTIRVSGICGTAVPPIGTNDQYTMTANTSLSVPAPGVLANDTSPGGQALSATIVDQPANGLLTFAASGGFTYTPTPAFTGSDQFRYRPVDTNGQGNLTTVTLNVTAVSTVQPPTGLFATTISGNTVALQWTPPASGPAPTGYVLDGGLSPGDTLASLPTGSANPVFTFTAPTGSFYVRMRSLAGNQSSGPSNEIVIHVNVPVPPSPPADLLGLASGSNLALAWKNIFAGGAPTGFTLQVSGSITASLPIAPADHFAFNGVPPGTYTLALRATNAAGASAPSNSVTLSFPQVCSGVPLTPVNLIAYKVGSTVFASWQPAASGGAPTAFVLNVSGAINASLPMGAARVISGAVAPGTYTLQVSATNACGVSALTAPVTVTIP